MSATTLAASAGTPLSTGSFYGTRPFPPNTNVVTSVLLHYFLLFLLCFSGSSTGPMSCPLSLATHPQTLTVTQPTLLVPSF